MVNFYKLITKDNALLFVTSIILLWALAEHSPNYYIILRWVTFLVAIYIGYKYYKTYYYIPTMIFALIAITFNPILPLYFRKTTWNFIDVLTALIMLFPVFHYYYIRRRYITNVEYKSLTKEEYLELDAKIKNTPKKEWNKLWKFMSELPPEDVACPYCDRTISTTDRYCRYCGKDLYEPS